MLGIFGSGSRASAKELIFDAGCFGKIPCQADFVRHNAGQREIMALDQWVQQAVALLTRRMAAGDDLWPSVPSMNFVSIGGDDERTVFGTIVPSRDRSGRTYPFVTYGFSVFPLLREIQSGAPVMLERFFGKARQLNMSAVTAESFDSVKMDVDALCIGNSLPSKGQVLDKMLCQLHSIPIADFGELVLGGATSDVSNSYLVTFADALREARRRQPVRISWGFRVKLGDEDHHMAGLIFSARLIDVALADTRWRAHYFWFKNEGTGIYEAAIFMRQPPSSLLLALASPTAGDGVLQDIGAYAESGKARVTEAISAGLAAATSVPDLINRIAAMVGK